MNHPESTGHSGAWTRLERKKSEPTGNTVKKRFGWLKSVLIALILIILVGSIAILSGRNKQRPVDWVHINAVNAKEDVHLPDGTKVILRKGSSISYSSDYGLLSRFIQLKGDAFFEVRYDSSIPFTVKALNEISTEEGTSFFVRSNDSVEQVFVSEGSVKFINNKNSNEYVVIHSGEKAELRGNKILLSKSESQNHLAWTNERLVFNRASLKQVAEDINNFYSVPVQIAPDINSHAVLVTAQFDNQPLPRILDAIGAQTGLVLQKENDSIHISKPSLNWENDPASETFEAGGNSHTSGELPPAIFNNTKKKKPFWKFWKKKS